jgi:hypothetical protein
VNSVHVDIMCVSGGERVPAIAARIGVRVGKVNVLDVLLEVAPGGAGLVAEGAAHCPAPHRLDVLLEAAGRGRSTS